MATVGRAEVKIVADARGFSRQAERAVERQLDRVDVDRSFARMGARGGESMLSGFTRSASRGVRSAHGPLVGILVTTLIPALIPVGAAAATALLFGFGSVIAGIGIVAAAQAPAVREAFSDVFGDIAQDLQIMARPLEPVLISVANEMASVFASAFQRPLSAAFQQLAPQLEVFNRDLGRAFESLGPAIQPVTDAFAMLLNELGPELANNVFPSLAEAIIDLAETIGGNADTFASILGFFLRIPEFIIEALTWLAQVAEWFAEHPEIMKLAIVGVGAVLGALIVAVGVFAAGLLAAAGPIALIGAALGALAVVFIAFRDDLVEGIKRIGRWFADIWGDIKSGANDLVGFFRNLPGRISNAVSGAFDGLWNAFRGAINNIISGWNSLSFSLPSVDTHIPGVGTIGGWTLHTPNIPFLQTGGLIDQAGMARVGEGGPETVFLPQGAVVDPRPMDQITGGGPDELILTDEIHLGDDIIAVVDRRIDLNNRRIASNARGGQRRTAATA